MLIAALGISYREAPVEVRERVAFPPCQARAFSRELVEAGVATEAVALSTCNRTEVYAVVETEEAREGIVDLLARDRGVEREEFEGYVFWHTGVAAVEHVYRVAASLDSMVIGEAQILGQVREAYRAATEERSTGPVLNRLFHTTLRVGKRVRSETSIGDHSLSVPRVATKLASDVFGTLSGRAALVLGAGEMSELVIESLRDAGVTEVRILNRTRQRAEDLAGRVGGAEVATGALGDELLRADVVVSSTGADEWVVDSETVAGALARRPGPIFFIDIAVPRDIDPAVQNLAGAYLYDIDDLRDVVEHNASDRSRAASEAARVISPEVEGFMAWVSTLHVVPLIRELRSEAERIRAHEVSRTVSGLDLTPEAERAIERMSQLLVNKLLHGPIAEIKARAEAGEPLGSHEVRKKLLALDDLGGSLGVEVSRHGTRHR
ncbi:hemA: glutamyl-tRNA reductase [Rubrobacter radiotolerans]|uniref:Glutamyl-tRNA reductase n=1 Tax=Rubrobacter radiotolerans TaxID=42256 RepID=A0A023X4X9_RUBRA|nr:glutamyl-tRNA reductase [Rubrobacter radiotolerans]AHY47040.1 hemA: glutamyl-tRNA reductase [Rubrobacter radiotolerans]MDX5894446.1 glutamyl-tRNA reductase [Rubrobacter radiotolerans]SMC06021.1 glutamyl-tRNA reductase [Rubrobacter radiotolerans DSM 5868]